LSSTGPPGLCWLRLLVAPGGNGCGLRLTVVPGVTVAMRPLGTEWLMGTTDIIRRVSSSSNMTITIYNLTLVEPAHCCLFADVSNGERHSLWIVGCQQLP
jgi:hypothetical protein